MWESSNRIWPLYLPPPSPSIMLTCTIKIILHTHYRIRMRNAMGQIQNQLKPNRDKWELQPYG